MLDKFNKFTFPLMMMAAMPCTAALDADSTLSKTLDEVVVEARAQNATAVSTTYLPSRRVKDSSQDAIDLLQRMSIPQISINPVSNEVSTISGQEVSVFINYLLATPEDIKGLRTGDVRKVEYLDFPDDPRFRGVPHAVNIIVAEYEYGGYTKLFDKQYVGGTFTNDASVYSKFSYKKMTYDVFAETDYVNSSHVGSSETAVYRLSNGTATRDMTYGSSEFSYLDLPVSLRASYNSEKVQVVNTLGFRLFDRFDNTRRGMISMSDVPSGSYSYCNVAPGINRTVSWSGQYYFSLRDKLSMAFYPTASYSHNTSVRRYHTDIPESSPINNDAGEDAWSLRLNAQLARKLDGHNSVKAILLGGSEINHVRYIGDSPYVTDFSNSYCSASAGYTLSLDRLNGTADAGVLCEFQRTNGQAYNDCYPFGHLSVNYSPDNKNQMSLWFQYATNSPDVSERSPNVIQTDELMYQTGAPGLENSRHVTVDVDYTFLPSNRFSATVFAGYFGNYDRSVAVYDLYDGGKALLRTYRNDGDYTVGKIGASATLKLLSNSLVLNVSPRWYHYKSSGYIDAYKAPFEIQFYGAWYVGNFSFSGFYMNRTHRFDSQTGAYTTERSYYHLAAGWSHKAWNVQAMALNFGRYGYDGSWSTLDSPLYSRRSVGYTANYRACFVISATYTFGYGKKLRRDDEVGAQSGGSSAIMQ